VELVSPQEVTLIPVREGGREGGREGEERREGGRRERQKHMTDISNVSTSKTHNSSPVERDKQPGTLM